MRAPGEESDGNATTDWQSGGYGERQQAGASADSDRVRKELVPVESHQRPVGDTAGMHDAENCAGDEAGHGAHPAGIPARPGDGGPPGQDDVRRVGEYPDRDV